MKKKLTALLLVVALVAVSIAGATMAYFTDTDQAVNVATVGNVKIEQHEYERVVDENGNWVTSQYTGYGYTADLMQPYTQGKPAFPAVYQDGDVKWDDRNGSQAASGEGSHQQPWSQVGAPGSNQLFDDSVKNVLDKFVFVENTGKSDLYYRTIIAIECPEGLSEHAIHTNFNANSRFDYNDEKAGSQNAEDSNEFYTEIDGVRYLVCVATYTDVLTPGEVSRPSLLQYFLGPDATNEDAALFGDTWEVLVYSQAVQTAGFSDADTALDAAFGDITKDSHPWSNTVIVDTNNEEKLLDALNSGKDIILNTDIVEIDNATFNGNGSTIILAGTGDNGGDHNYGYLAFAPGKGNDTKVENLTVTGSGFVEVGHYEEGDGDYIVNNLTIADLAATFAVNNCGNDIAAAFAHYGNATLNNCVMTGTTATAFSAGHTIYDASFVNGTKTTINGGEYGKIYLANQAHVTIENAEVGEIDTYAITTRNLGMLTIGDDAKVGTINVYPVGSYPLGVTIKAGAEVGTINLNASQVNLTIENGATVDAIVYNDVTYTQSAWNEIANGAEKATTADELVKALENNDNVVLLNDVKIDPANMSNAYGTTGINIKNGQTIDGNGNTLDIKGAGGTWDSGINTTGGTIRNLTVTGSFRGIFINHNSDHSEPVVLENVTIDGTTYTISCDQGMNQGLTATNSTFNGWTSYAATLGDAKFVDCNFGEGNGYAYCRPYAPTTFVGCNFEAGYEMDARAAVTFENCTIGGVPLTAENLATLVTSNIANATVIK